MPTALEIEVNAPIRSKVLATGIALSSFSALLLELGLTRVFSVVLFYHFAFLAISIALLGLGAGGVFAHLRKQKLQEYELRNFASTCSCLNALMIPLVLEIVLHVPVSLERVFPTHRGLLPGLLLYSHCHVLPITTCSG